MSEPEIVAHIAGCVIKQDSKYLLIQEKLPKAYGLWNIPAGYVDKGETPGQAAVREAREETGYDVEIDSEVGKYIDGDKLRHAFTAHIIGGELRPDKNEILDAKWQTFADITTLNDTNQIRAPWIFEAISAVEQS